MKKFEASGLFSINDSFSLNAKPSFLEKTKQKSSFFRLFRKRLTTVGRVVVLERFQNYLKKTEEIKLSELSQKKKHNDVMLGNMSKKDLF